MKHKVFVTYSRHDAGITDKIVDALGARNIDVLLDRRDIAIGEDWAARLGQLIREADTILFMLTPESAASKVCAWEVAEAKRLGKRILPVVLRKLDGVDVPIGLAELNWIFLTEPSDFAAFETLVQAVVAGAKYGNAGAGHKVFISYKRAESQHVAGRIYDHLEREFGDSNIFFDVERIPLGVDFRDYIRDAVLESQVLLAVVGKKWLRPDTKRRFAFFKTASEQEEFARIEVELAIEHSVRIIPLLIDGAKMPRKEELPISISQCSYLNAKEMRAGADFKHDIAEVIQSIRNPLTKTLGRAASVQRAN